MSGEAVWIREAATGRLGHEIYGDVPFGDVPPSPYYRPTPGSWLSTRAWLDEDGRHVVAAHDCTDKRRVSLLPWPSDQP